MLDINAVEIAPICDGFNAVNAEAGIAPSCSVLNEPKAFAGIEAN